MTLGIAKDALNDIIDTIKFYNENVGADEVHISLPQDDMRELCTYIFSDSTLTHEITMQSFCCKFWLSMSNNCAGPP